MFYQNKFRSCCGLKWTDDCTGWFLFELTSWVSKQNASHMILIDKNRLKRTYQYRILKSSYLPNAVRLLNLSPPPCCLSIIGASYSCYRLQKRVTDFSSGGFRVPTKFWYNAALYRSGSHFFPHLLFLYHPVQPGKSVHWGGFNVWCEKRMRPVGWAFTCSLTSLILAPVLLTLSTRRLFHPAQSI